MLKQKDWNNKEFVLAAVQQDGGALQCAATALQADREVVLAAVQQNGRAFQYANAILKRDRGFVLAAVQQNARALQYADSALKRDREVVLAAVKKKGGHFNMRIQYFKQTEKSSSLPCNKTMWQFAMQM